MLRKRVFLYIIAAFGVTALTALGCWQVDRLAWKTNLIRAVDSRVHMPAAPAPGPDDWPAVSSDHDAYRHIYVKGVLLNDLETLVYASTIHGAGYWVMTPLRTEEGFIVLINRGFVPPDHRAPTTRPEGQMNGKTTITGLLRITEPGGGFLRANEPEEGRWYSRDVAAITAARHLTNAAPYFIDADDTPNPGALPIGGLTVISFYNHHLEYAITWFTLDAMLIFYIFIAVRKPESPHG